MVFSEPGHPYPGLSFDSRQSSEDLLRSTVTDTYNHFRNGTDLFHRNVRWFMNRIFSGLTFDEQLRFVWLIEGRLCSVDMEIGGKKDPLCGQTYLRQQVALMPNATVVACGGKARPYLEKLGIGHEAVWAMAPPGANRPEAKMSWEGAITMISNKRKRAAI